MSFLLIIPSCLALAIIWWYIKYYYYYNTMWDIPVCKKTLPILGNLLAFTSITDALFDFHQHLKTTENYKTIRICLGYNYGLSSSHPPFLKHIMTHSNSMDKPFFPFHFFHQWLHLGLFTTNGAKWRLRRKLLTPAYHFKILEEYLDVFDKNGSVLVEQLRYEVGTDKTDLHVYIPLLALDNICETAMGITIDAQKKRNSEYVLATDEMIHIIMNRVANPFKHSDLLYSLTNDYRCEKKALKVIHSFILSVIKSRRKELLTKTDNSIKNEEDSETKEKKSFLNLILQSTLDGVPLSDADIQEEVATFMTAGYDTVASAMSFCLYCLSTNPEVQEKVLAEQRNIYQNNPNRNTTYNDLNRMKYLEMVIKETMRLYPTAPLILRSVTEDMQYGKSILKKDLILAINVYTLHRNPIIYPDPEHFDPLRFSTEMQAKRDAFAYLPFSAGNRNCIGQKYAMLEMKSTVSKLVRNYNFLPAKDYSLRLKTGMILSTTNGIFVKLTNRIW